jgi:hypothetical protein
MPQPESFRRQASRSPKPGTLCRVTLQPPPSNTTRPTSYSGGAFSGRGFRKFQKFTTWNMTWCSGDSLPITTYLSGSPRAPTDCPCSPQLWRTSEIFAGASVLRDGDPRHGCAHYRSDGHARHVPSRPPDHQLLILRGHDVRLPAGQQGDRSPTFSRRSPSSPFSIRSTHQRARWARLAGFDFGRDASGDWHRPRPLRRPRRRADV